MASAAFKIEKGIPAIKSYGGPGKSKFPFSNMEIGDSFFVPWGDDPIKMRSVLSNAMAAFHLRNKPKRFTSHKIEGGVRVWRIEDEAA